MVFSNLAGTTSNKFEIGSRPIGDGQYGQIAASNIYDIYWGGNHPSTGGSSAIATRLGPNQDILNVDVGQYYYIDTSSVRNGPGVQEQFVMLVEPANGYFLGQKRYTLKYVNNGGIWIYDDTARRLGWQKIPFASDVSAGPTVETGTFTFNSNAVTITPNNPSVYAKYGNLCYVSFDFEMRNNGSSSALIGVGGLPFKAVQFYEISPISVSGIFSSGGNVYGLFIVPTFYYDNGFTMKLVGIREPNKDVSFYDLYNVNLSPDFGYRFKGSFIYPCK